MTNSVDPDQTAPEGRSSLIWVCTICICHFIGNLDVQNFRTFTESLCRNLPESSLICFGSILVRPMFCILSCFLIPCFRRFSNLLDPEDSCLLGLFQRFMRYAIIRTFGVWTIPVHFWYWRMVSNVFFALYKWNLFRRQLRFFWLVFSLRWSFSFLIHCIRPNKRMCVFRVTPTLPNFSSEI